MDPTLNQRRAPRGARGALLPLVASVPTTLLVLGLVTGCAEQGDSSSGAVERSALQDKARNGADDAGAMAAEEDAAVAEDGDTIANSDVEVTDREVIHTADLTVEVDDIQKAVEATKREVTDAGGYISAEHVSAATGAAPQANLVVKVPVDSYDAALEDLSALGERVNLDRNEQDVTEEVADVDSRVESAEASLERLRELLDEAESVEDILSIEREISNRQADLEALLARQQTLASQTDYGTVRLELLLPDSYIPAAEDSDSIGFLGGLLQGWRALVTVGATLAVALGWSLPFLAILAAVAVPGWLLLRRRRHGGAATVAGHASSAETTETAAAGADGDPGSAATADGTAEDGGADAERSPS
ncbi:DUF4349 domain-containing protein [Salinactinospora qingdaonensis]|uniref:DUF4349 domain-containing protein n=1 Tax=Salinactinospora qingdaonensis TaxID=702744 RepID=A0ABP7EZA5_9ACTN